MKPDRDAVFVTTHYVSAEYHKNHPQRVHRHEDELELLFFVSGEGPYIVAGKEYYVQAGSMVICDAQVMHGESPVQYLEKESYCCVLKDLQMEGMPANTLISPGSNPILTFGDQRGALEHIYLALHSLSRKKEYADVCQNLAESILQIVLDQLQKRKEPVTPSDSRSEEELIEGIMDYLDHHFTEEISIDQLADHFHISAYYVSKFFKKAIGIAPTRYILNRRIGEAQKLLMNTEMPIGEIGSQVGIEDMSFFSRQFKKYVGITPSAFRAYHRENIF